MSTNGNESGPLPENGSEEKLRRQAGSAMSRSARKFLLMVGALALCVAALHFTPAGRALRDLQTLKERIQDTGPWAPLVFFAVTTILSAIGCPRSVVHAAGGMIFGFRDGLGLSLAGSLAGSHLTFIFARWSGGHWVEEKVRHMRRIQFVRKNQSIFSVVLIRQLPVANIMGNLLLSLTEVKHGVFLLGSLLGFLPAAVIITLSASSLVKDDAHLSVIQLVMAGLLLLIMAGAVWHLKKKWDSG